MQNSNAQGGTLYIGVDDNGNVIGLDSKVQKKLLEDIPNKITAAFGITCDVNLKSKDKKKYIQVEVKKSRLPLNLHGRYYYRTGSVKKEITGFELTEFIIKSTGTSDDAMISDILRDMDVAMKIAKAVTDVYVENWTDISYAEFEEQLPKIKATVEEMVDSSDDGKLKLSFTGRNGLYWRVSLIERFRESEVY